MTRDEIAEIVRLTLAEAPQKARIIERRTNWIGIIAICLTGITIAVGGLGAWNSTTNRISALDEKINALSQQYEQMRTAQASSLASDEAAQSTATKVGDLKDEVETMRGDVNRRLDAIEAAQQRGRK